MADATRLSTHGWALVADDGQRLALHGWVAGGTVAPTRTHFTDETEDIRFLDATERIVFEPTTD